MTTRKGLKRYGMRAYIVEGDKGTMIIRRMAVRNYQVRPQSYDVMPWGIFGIRFTRLGDAAEFCRRECFT